MNSDNIPTISGTGKTIDWRILFALVTTSLWLLYWLYYLGFIVGWGNFLAKPLESLGSFLEGAFAPLAFLWLVVGYFLQQKELSRNTDAIQQQHVEMSKSLEYAATQAKSLEASTYYNQQQTFMQIYQLAQITLGSVVGMLFLSSQGQSGNESIDREQMVELWNKMTHGDSEVFSRRMLLIRAEGEQSMHDLFFGTEVRRRHSDNFSLQFGQLLARAQECDDSGIIAGVLKTCAHGLFYQLILDTEEQGPN